MIKLIKSNIEPEKYVFEQTLENNYHTPQRLINQDLEITPN